MASATRGRMLRDLIARHTQAEGRGPHRSGATAANAVTDCRGVTHITARGLPCGASVAVEQVLSAEDGPCLRSSTTLGPSAPSYASSGLTIGGNLQSQSRSRRLPS